MNKKIKKNIVNNFLKLLPSDSKFIRVTIILLTLAVLIIVLYLLYRGASKAWYMYRLKKEFYKLKDMGFDVKNYNIHYNKVLKKKYNPHFFNIINGKNGDFKNKKHIGFVPNKYIVLDIDTKDSIKDGNFLINKIPKDTAYEKTPNGYHYYFENDTGHDIYSYVQLDICGENYSVDILGVDSLVTMTPSSVDGKSYYWINSIFTHKPAKVSENTWILDLIKNNKPFNRKFDGFDFNIKVKNAFIVIDNLHIENQFRFFLRNTNIYNKKIKLLNGIIYKYGDNYYFMTNNSFNTCKNKKKILLKLKNIIDSLNPSIIIDFSFIYSNYLPSEKIFHIRSCAISDDYKNYKYDDFFPQYVEINNLYTKTNYLINDTIMIYNYNSENLKNKKYDLIKNNTNDKIVIGSESIYITSLLSNYLNIPCLCIATTYTEQFDEIYNIIHNDSEKNNNNLIKNQKENLNKLMIHFTSLF